MDNIYLIILIFIFCLAVFDLMVGVSNDAVNFLQSALGAKAASFRVVLLVAAAGVFFGAVSSNGMMEIARHGIFLPQYFYFSELMCIFLAVMVTDVVLLDVFNSLGLPTSTTVSLIFELLGGTVALAMIKSISSDGALQFAEMINTDKALTVIIGIFLSIAIAFFFGTLVQYITRIIFTFNYKKNLKWFAGLFGGVAITSILYFLLIKGAKDASFMTEDVKHWISNNAFLIVTVCFLGSTLLMQIVHFLKGNVFKFVVLLGTFALAMAFAGNDLVNFIGVPLAGLSSFNDYMANGTELGVNGYLMESLNSPANTNVFILLAAGAIMVYSLVTSKKAHNVIKTSLELSRQNEGEEIFSSSKIARRVVSDTIQASNWVVKNTPKRVSTWIEGRFNKDEMIMEKGASYDLIRASVNLVLAALLIALGTSLKLPLSTTFVTFMVAMGSSLADKAWTRESAVFRVSGVIQVIGGWFLTAGVAFIACFLVVLIMYYGGVIAMIGMALLAVTVIFLSNRRFKKKTKAAKEDVLFTEIINAQDPKEVWAPLKKHIHTTVLEELNYVSDFYNKLTDCFINQDRRCMKKLSDSIGDQKEIYKKSRRKELVGMQKVDPIIGLEATTWFHLTSNNTIQLLYSLRRITEPCKEHIDNNFNLLPEESKNEFMPLRDELILLLEGTFHFVKSNGSDKELVALVKRISAYKKEANKALDNLYKRIHKEKNSCNLNIYMLYQVMLQESLQIADSLKHLSRAIYKLQGVESK